MAINVTKLTSTVSHNETTGIRASYEAVLLVKLFFLPSMLRIDRARLNDSDRNEASILLFLPSFCQSWTADGPDGRHGRCVGATARTRGGERATNRYPAMVADLAREETLAWRIALVACATVSHRQTFLCLDCACPLVGIFLRIPQTSDELRAISSRELKEF